MPNTAETITITMAPRHMIGSIAGMLITMWAGVWVIVDVVVNERIANHATTQHQATQKAAEDNAQKIVFLDRNGVSVIRADMVGIKTQQSAFSTDIDWIKAQQLKTDSKIDRILDKLAR